MLVEHVDTALCEPDTPASRSFDLLSTSEMNVRTPRTADGGAQVHLAMRARRIAARISASGIGASAQAATDRGAGMWHIWAISAGHKRSLTAYDH
jgi:hypothetical protein